MSEHAKIQLYSAPWCPDCTVAVRFLDGLGVEYDVVNIDEVEGAAERLAAGVRRHAHAVLQGARVLVLPVDLLAVPTSRPTSRGLWEKGRLWEMETTVMALVAMRNPASPVRCRSIPVGPQPESACPSRSGMR